jgi:ABC-type transporter Mla maintaining outer membrane lipid asymmetry ATPase subunit MlaF
LVFEAGARMLHQLTIAENIALPLCYHRDCRIEEAEERVNEMLEFAGINELARQLPGSLSRTYLQRASLARALVLSPELLLLDNPLAGVDQSERKWWQETVTSLWRGHQITGSKPMTIVIVTNHLTPWLEEERNFALLQGNCWRQLGKLADLERSDEHVLNDLLARDK